jgi:hypothetical protein
MVLVVVVVVEVLCQVAGQRIRHAPGSREAAQLHLLGDEPPELVVLVMVEVQAAVMAPEDERKSWFSWPIWPHTGDSFVKAGRLLCPELSWLTMGP